jgi:transposase-like protein
VEGAYSNLSCTGVRAEGCQKSKRLSYTAKFKREVIQCTEEKGNRKAAAIFGVDESNVRLWQKGQVHIETQATQPTQGRAVQVSVIHTFEYVSAS